MSYILDALRKSDQQRRHRATTAMICVPPPAEEPRRRIVLRLGALAATLFIAGLGIGWWQPWQADKPQPMASSATLQGDQPMHARVAQETAPPVTDAPAKSPELAQWASSPANEALALAPSSSSSVAPAAGGVSNATTQNAATEVSQPPANAKHDTSAQRERESPDPVGPVGKESSPVAAPQTILKRSDLPASIQQEIPKIVVSLHAYSNKPASRLISANDHLLHEGDSLAPGLTLEQITPDDMVFSFKGFLFRQGVR